MKKIIALGWLIASPLVFADSVVLVPGSSQQIGSTTVLCLGNASSLCECQKSTSYTGEVDLKKYSISSKTWKTLEYFTSGSADENLRTCEKRVTFDPRCFSAE